MSLSSLVIPVLLAGWLCAVWGTVQMYTVP